MHPLPVLVFALFVCTVPLGTNSLKCYHCSEFSGADAIDCKAPKEKECAKDENRCIKIQVKPNTGFGDEIAVNCSTSATCNGFCKDFKQKHSDVEECLHKCCEGDLCNHPYNFTITVVVGPTETPENGTSLASSTESPATGTSSGTGTETSTIPGEPRSAEPSSLIQNVKALALLPALMGLILVF